MEEKQIIEVKFNEELVKEDLKAQEENNEELIVQDTFNEDGVDELIGEGAEIINEQENN